jgi:hypothetical protein
MGQRYQDGRKVVIRPDQGGRWGWKLPHWNSVSIVYRGGFPLISVLGPIGRRFDALDDALARSGLDQPRMRNASRFTWVRAGFRPAVVIRGNPYLLFAEHFERMMALHEAVGTAAPEGQWQWHAGPQPEYGSGPE